ncbi:MAG TPA: pseudouridine synthase [Devosiaceae bacterium]
MSETGDQPAPAERLAKIMARHGLCSRREAEQWIRDGRVAVNGQKVMTPAFNVATGDAVTVDGAPLAPKRATRIWLYHKPAGLVVTEHDPEGRPTVFEKLADEGLPRVLSVGRLDINTEGLLLLTNDGGLKRVLELPATGWLRRYRVRAHGTVTQAQLDELKSGMEIEGIKYGSIEATLERVQGSNVWLLVGLREGKNREVKNVLGALGLEVNRLIRVSFGPFQLGDMPIGAVEVVRSRVLRDQLGRRLAAEAGVDFDAPLPEDDVEGGERPAPSRSRPQNEERRPAPRNPRPQHGQRPERPQRKPAERAPEGRPRRIHFDDGRPSEEFTPSGRDRRGKDERPERGGRPDRNDRQDRPDRPGRSDRPQRTERPDRAPAQRSDRPRRDAPSAPARDDRGARPERREDRGPRKTFGDDRGPRRSQTADRGPRREAGPDRGARPERSDSRGPRREFSEDRGPRRERSDERGPGRAPGGNRGPRTGTRDEGQRPRSPDQSRPSRPGGQNRNDAGKGRPARPGGDRSGKGPARNGPKPEGRPPRKGPPRKGPPRNGGPKGS